MRAIDLFAGAGGVALALRQFGITASHYEIDEDAVATLAANGFSDVCKCDIAEVSWSGFGVVDLLWASPPCQSFSKAQKRERRVTDPWGMTLRAIRDLLPARIVIENVNGAPWDRWRADLENLGYLTSLHRLNAKDFGVPQFRRRTFLICGRSKPVKSPEYWASRVSGTLQDCLEPVGDRRVVEVGHGYAGYQPWRLFKPAPTVTTTDSKGTRACSSSGYRFRLGPDRLSDALFLALGWCKATIRECANAQGFPSSYMFFGSQESRYRQIGNAVPPPLALAVIRSAMS